MVCYVSTGGVVLFVCCWLLLLAGWMVLADWDVLLVLMLLLQLGTFAKQFPFLGLQDNRTEN